MKIGIVGGQLQGLEAVYLAKQAGFETTVIDKNPHVPARYLSDAFVHEDVTDIGHGTQSLISQFDLLLPATENLLTLGWLHEAAVRLHIPLALDFNSFQISASKRESNRLFSRLHIPMPGPWPDCGCPVIIKPSNASGSAGVVKAENKRQVAVALADVGGDAVIQKYEAGPSFSLEVLAHEGTVAGFQITELAFDAGYDCKRVLAGPEIGPGMAKPILDLAERISLAMRLSGVMDIEVIQNDGGIHVLEIDARLPSQTPTAVFHSTGINMVRLLAEYWIDGKMPPYRLFSGNSEAVIYEHYRFDDGVLEVTGEHALADARDLKVFTGEFSSSVFISNFESSKSNWVGTAVFSANSAKAVWEIRHRAIEEIQKTFPCRHFIDPEPENASF